ncbi:MAG: hypothetical protein ACREFO_01295 [Acetobacteraceae bacterium]
MAEMVSAQRDLEPRPAHGEVYANAFGRFGKPYVSAAESGFYRALYDFQNRSL